MRAPVIAAAATTQDRPSIATPMPRMIVRLGWPDFHIGFYLRRDTWLNGRGLHLGIVICRRFLRRLCPGDLVDAASDHLVHGSLTSILWRKLACLECPLDEDVVALVEQRCDIGKLAVEHQAVPVGMFLRLVTAIRVTIALRHPDIRDRCAGGKVPHGWFRAEIA